MMTFASIVLYFLSTFCALFCGGLLRESAKDGSALALVFLAGAFVCFLAAAWLQTMGAVR